MFFNDKCQYEKTIQLTNDEGVEVLGIDKNNILYIREDYYQMTFMHYKMDLEGNILEKKFNDSDESDGGLDPKSIPFNHPSFLHCACKSITKFPFFVFPTTRGQWLGPVETNQISYKKIESEESTMFMDIIPRLEQDYNYPAKIVGKLFDYSTSEIKWNEYSSLITRKIGFVIERKKRFHTRDKKGQKLKEASLSISVLQFINLGDEKQEFEIYPQGRGMNEMTAPYQLFDIGKKILVVDNVRYQSDKNKIHIFNKNE